MPEMKRDISHLPPEKQDELRRVVERIRDDVDPEMVILFGSHARGDWVEDRHQEGHVLYEYVSDYDLLVIIRSPNDEGGSHKLYRRVEDRIREVVPPGTHVNAIVHNIDFVNTKLAEGQYFFTDIAREGIMLFEAGRHNLAAPKDLSIAERKRVAQESFQQWFVGGQRQLATSGMQTSEGWLSEAAFSLHQATERFYSAALLVFTGHKPKTHDLGELGRLATAHVPALLRVFPRATETERARFDLLNRAYIDARYKPDYEITREDLEYLGARVEELRAVVEAACRAKIDSLSPGTPTPGR